MANDRKTMVNLWEIKKSFLKKSFHEFHWIPYYFRIISLSLSFPKNSICRLIPIVSNFSPYCYFRIIFRIFLCCHFSIIFIISLLVRHYNLIIYVPIIPCYFSYRPDPWCFHSIPRKFPFINFSFISLLFPIICKELQEKKQVPLHTLKYSANIPSTQAWNQETPEKQKLEATKKLNTAKKKTETANHGETAEAANHEEKVLEPMRASC